MGISRLSGSDIIAVLERKNRVKICSSLGRRNCPLQHVYQSGPGISLMPFGSLLSGMEATDRDRLDWMLSWCWWLCSPKLSLYDILTYREHRR